MKKKKLRGSAKKEPSLATPNARVQKRALSLSARQPGRPGTRRERERRGTTPRSSPERSLGCHHHHRRCAAATPATPCGTATRGGIHIYGARSFANLGRSTARRISLFAQPWGENDYCCGNRCAPLPRGLRLCCRSCVYKRERG